jgi:hypothetical protein
VSAEHNVKKGDLIRFVRRSRKRGLKVARSSESSPTSDRAARRFCDLIFNDAIPRTSGLHPCTTCGIELDGDDPKSRCEECITPPASEVSE